MEAKEGQQRLQRLMAWGLAFFGVVMGAAYRFIAPQAFHFFPNPYALPWLFGTLGNLFLIVLLLRFRVKTRSTYWFIFFVASLAVWSGCELLQALSRTAEAAVFWSTLSSFGFVTVPVTFLVFAFLYMRKDSINQPLLIIFLVVSTIFFLHLTLDTDAVITNQASEMKRLWWGYNTQLNGWFFFFMAWFEALFLVSLANLVQYYRQSRRVQIRNQTRVIIVAILIPFVIGTFTDGVLPALGIVVFPMAMLLTSVMAAIITYAIITSDLLVVSPASIAWNILDAMQEAVVVIGADQTVEYGNRRAAVLFSRTQNQFEGLALRDLFGRETSELLRRLKALKNQRFLDLSTVEIGKNNAVPVNITAAPISDERGQSVGSILILTDVTQLERSNATLHAKVRQIREQNARLAELGEQLQQEKDSIERKVRSRTRELGESKAQLLASIASLDLGYIMSDAKQRIILLNEAALRILQPTTHAASATFAGKTLAHLFSAVPELLVQIDKSLSEQVPVELKEVAYQELYLRMYVSPVISGERAIGTVVLVEDITAQKVLERSKDEFFSIASHELRTPLTAIRGYSDFLRERYSAKMKDEFFNHSIENIFRSSTQLIQIVNEFLDLSRLEQGRIHFLPEAFGLEDLISEVEDGCAALLQERDLHLVFRRPKHPLPLVWADRTKTKQVLTNLVGNAIKYTEEGGIVVQVRVADELIVRVHDTGRGIPVENQALLFRKFQQAESDILTRDVSMGTGLGLYISKLIVEGMGGRIFLERSTPGHGSTFTFTLPIKTDGVNQ